MCYKRHDADRLRPCMKCYSVYYCQTECQESHWQSIHQFECDGFVHSGEKFDHPLTAVIIHRPYLMGVFRSFIDHKYTFNESVHYRSLQSYMNLYDGDNFQFWPAQQMKDIDDHCSALTYFVMSQIEKKEPSISDYVHHSLQVTIFIKQSLGIWRLNAIHFGDDDSGLTDFATAVYPYLSLCEHRCNPNCRLTFVGSIAAISSIRDIAVGESHDDFICQS
jgi:hypothetical protein